MSSLVVSVFYKCLILLLNQNKFPIFAALILQPNEYQPVRDRDHFNTRAL